MLNPHDLSVLRHGRDPKAIRQGLWVCGKRVVTGYRHPLRKSPEQHGIRVRLHHGLLSVHETFCIGHGRTVSRADRLMSEADTQGRDTLPENLCCFYDDPRVLRSPRSRRKDDMVRSKRPDLLHGHLIISDHPDIRVDLTDHLKQIV